MADSDAAKPRSKFYWYVFIPILVPALGFLGKEVYTEWLKPRMPWAKPAAAAPATPPAAAPPASHAVAPPADKPVAAPGRGPVVIDD